MTSWCQRPYPISLPPSLTWRVGYECVVLCRIQKWHYWQWLLHSPCVTEKPNMVPDSFLYFAHMKLVGRLVTAAAFNRACHCLYLCLQNTKWAVARNEPLHFLTTASQIDVSVVSSQMFPSTAMLPNIVLQGWTSRVHFIDTHSFAWGLSTLQWFHNKNSELIPSTPSVLAHCDKWWAEHKQSKRPGQCVG